MKIDGGYVAGLFGGFFHMNRQKQKTAAEDAYSGCTKTAEVGGFYW